MKRTIVLLVILLMVTGGVLFLKDQNYSTSQTETNLVRRSDQSNVTDLLEAPSPTDNSKVSTTLDQKNYQTTLQSIEEIESKLHTVQSLEEEHSILVNLKNELLSNPNRTAVIQALKSWLKSEADFKTNLKFRPGKNGDLSSWDSGRVFALDVLSLLSIEETNAYAWELLKSSNHSSESIIALKVIAQADGKGIKHNKKWVEHLSEIYTNQSWWDNPNHAQLYGLDIFVYTEQSEFLPLLETLGNVPNKALSHAAKLATTRMVYAAPTSSFEQLLNNPTLWSSDLDFKAQLFAYADPTDPNQTVQLERFLLDSARNNAPLDQFFQTFPNLNRGVSYNLLSKTTASSMAHAAKTDKAALNIITKIADENRFPQYRNELSALQERLEEFVNAAERGKLK